MCHTVITLEVRVLFEGGPGEAITTHLDLVNSGTTVLYYSWEHVPNPNPLGTRLHESIQRFYFDTEGGKFKMLTTSRSLYTLFLQGYYFPDNSSLFPSCSSLLRLESLQKSGHYVLALFCVKASQSTLY